MRKFDVQDTVSYLLRIIGDSLMPNDPAIRNLVETINLIRMNTDNLARSNEGNK